MKICGVKNLDTAYSCYELGVDAIGLHALGSIETAIGMFAGWTSVLPSELSVFLLTDSNDSSAILEACEMLGCDTVQLQGRMSAELVVSLARSVRNEGVRLVKSVAVPSKDELRQLREYLGQILPHVDAILLDSAWRGGTGKRADLQVATELAAGMDVPLIVAGGISDENVAEVVNVMHPYGVDVESSVEWHFWHEGRRIAAKSVKKIERLVMAVRNIPT